ncbi:hypothetical protein P8452_72478 [Trifolium repens]|nr:hypothetical protein P8452_72478 [Trifolium repens]
MSEKKRCWWDWIHSNRNSKESWILFAINTQYGILLRGKLMKILCKGKCSHSIRNVYHGACGLEASSMIHDVKP